MYVMKPRSENIDSEMSVLSVEELVDLDEIEFASGVVLCNGCLDADCNQDLLKNETP